MANKPSFSIITPVFNGERFIAETVESVLRNAPSGDFEYLVIDDGSTDSTSLILQTFGNLISVIKQPNSGEASAVNVGLEASKGKYALVVSADDPLISRDLFVLSKEILDANPEVVVSYPDWYLIDEFGEILREITTPEFSIYELVGLNKCIPGPGAIFRVRQALLIGGRSKNLKFGSDYEFWLRMSELGTFQRIPKFLAQWRSHENSTSIKSRGEKMALERIQIMENFLAESDLPENIRKIALGNAYYSAAILRYFSKAVPHRKYLAKGFLIRRGIIENVKFSELTYLIFIPFSEFIWQGLKKLMHFELR